VSGLLIELAAEADVTPGILALIIQGTKLALLSLS
jgi:hypothetical protein